MKSEQEFTWVNVTTWALRDWEAAQHAYDEHHARARLYAPDASPRERNLATARLDNARRNYRQRVLSWFWKLCTPLTLGESVPDEVAILLAEEWDQPSNSTASLSARGLL